MEKIAIGLTRDPDDRHAVAVRWTSSRPEHHVLVLDIDGGDVLLSRSAAADLPCLEPLDGPSGEELSLAVSALLAPTLDSSRAADDLWVSAQYELIRWYPAAVLPNSARRAVESAVVGPGGAR